MKMRKLNDEQDLEDLVPASEKRRKSRVEKKVTEKDGVKQIVTIVKGMSGEIDKDGKEDDQMKRIIKSISIILRKGDDIDRKKSRKKLLDIINNIDEDKEDITIGEEIIEENETEETVTNTKERIRQFLINILDQRYVKSKYFFLWRSMVDSKPRVRKSIRRVKFTRKDNNKEINTDDANKDKENDNEKEFTEL